MTLPWTDGEGSGAATLAIAAAGLGSLVASSPELAPGVAQLDDATFEGDVTFPDGSVVAPSQTFTKVWQLRNSGSVRWEGRYLTRVNSTPCQAPDADYRRAAGVQEPVHVIRRRRMGRDAILSWCGVELPHEVTVLVRTRGPARSSPVYLVYFAHSAPVRRYGAL